MHDVAGTTRDSIDTPIKFEDRDVVLVDTAACGGGPRWPGPWTTTRLRSEQAAERADVAIVVCDASEGVTSDDLRVARRWR